MSKNKKVIENSKTNENNVKNQNKEEEKVVSSTEKNLGETKTMKILISVGVIVLFICVVYICYHFFVQENNIGINMSTDKELVYVTLDGEEVLTTTQKYVSDVGYSMRYDVNSFRVFKYKDMDIFKNLEDENVLIVIEKAELPSSCGNADTVTIYSSCYVNIDDYEDDYYIYNSDVVLKISVNTRGEDNTSSEILDLIDYMLDTFEITA